MGTEALGATKTEADATACSRTIAPHGSRATIALGSYHDGNGPILTYYSKRELAGSKMKYLGRCAGLNT
eukprot:scaffold23250_cov31-Tisochrysis_lutea.AAC.3